MTGQTTDAPSRRFRPYPAYRDSGVAWLAEIPKHWRVKRLSWLTKCLDGERVPLNAEERGRMQGDIPYWGANSIVDYVDQWLFDEELVLLGEDGAPFFDKSKPVAFRVKGRIWVNNHAHVLRPHAALDSRFLAYALNCVDYGAFIDGSTRDKLTQDDMRAIAIQCPYVEEQRAIATFLDRETAKIDALVASKERLIELLQEKRTALITRAVTRGLVPNVPMKDSGVQWLGEIPAHWELMPLKRILRRCDYGISESLVGSGDIRVLTMAHVQDGEIVLPDDGSIDAVDRTLVLESGDLLFNRTNSRELVGKVGIFRGHRRDQVTFASYLVRLTARDNVEAEWLNYLLNSTGLLGMARSMALLSVNQANLNPTKYQRIVVPMPELSEQRRIAGLAKREATRIDTLIRKVRVAIDRLREFRTVVISAAVTGKVDVREAVPR